METGFRKRSCSTNSAGVETSRRPHAHGDEGRQHHQLGDQEWRFRLRRRQRPERRNLRERLHDRDEGVEIERDQRGAIRPASMRATTIAPARIANRLTTTCRLVKVAVDMPRIMACLRAGALRCRQRPCWRRRTWAGLRGWASPASRGPPHARAYKQVFATAARGAALRQRRRGGRRWRPQSRRPTAGPRNSAGPGTRH